MQGRLVGEVTDGGKLANSYSNGSARSHLVLIAQDSS